MHRAQKRMQSPLSLNEISPHLAAIQSSCISMPGHTQQDEVWPHPSIIGFYRFVANSIGVILSRGLGTSHKDQTQEDLYDGI